MKKPSKTNWARIDALKEKDIDYSDNPKLTSGFFKQAVRLEIGDRRADSNSRQSDGKGLNKG